MHSRVKIQVGILAGVAATFFLVLLLVIFVPIMYFPAKSDINSLGDSVELLENAVLGTGCLDGCETTFTACTTVADCPSPVPATGVTVSTLECSTRGYCYAELTLPEPAGEPVGALHCRQALPDAADACLSSIAMPVAGTVSTCAVINRCLVVEW